MQIGKKHSPKEIRSLHSFSKKKKHCYPVVSPGRTQQVCGPGEIWSVWISKMPHRVSGLDKYIGNDIVPWRSNCFRDGEHKVGTNQEALSMLSSIPSITFILWMSVKCEMTWVYFSSKDIQSKDEADSEELHKGFIKLAEWQNSKENPM